jgi:diguanylate cyclase (GGDEF)-like protein
MNLYGRSFWWTSAIATLFTIFSLVALYEWHGRGLLVQNQSRSSLHIVQTLGNVVWPQHGEFITTAITLPNEQLSKRAEQLQLMKTILNSVRDLPVLKVKIFAPKTGITLFSTELKQIGSSKHESEGLISARSGVQHSTLEHKRTFAAIDRVVLNRDIVASYVPFYSQGSRVGMANPDMIMEVYLDVTDALSQHKANRAQLAFSVTAALSFMYVVIFVFGRKASKSLIQAEILRKKHEALTQHRAFHDYLTSLPNRASFNQRLRTASKQKPLQVVFLDLDGFKAINDTFGHKTGDRVLRVLAKRLSKLMKDKDQIFRLGGDEFLVLRESDQVIESHQLAKRIIDAVAKPMNIEGINITLTASIGIAQWPLDDSDIEAVVRCADVAMYEAKRAGANQVTVYRPAMRESIQAQANLMEDLKNAHVNREFVLHYQPRVAVKDRAIESVEALIRWQHPLRGFLTPNEFIEALEDSPLIIDVGRWVVEEACRQAVKWQTEGAGKLKISVNVAAKQFRSVDFVKSVESALSSSGLAPNCLELELTEGHLIGDLDAAIGTLNALKALGVSIAIDDFGTGYSSLSYLHRLPVDCLKIDRSFVMNISKESKTFHLAKTIVLLGKNLGLKVVAEGVETTYQADLLSHWGCDQLQGYLFSKPVAPHLIQNLIKSPIADDMNKLNSTLKTKSSDKPVAELV